MKKDQNTDKDYNTLITTYFEFELIEKNKFFRSMGTPKDVVKYICEHSLIRFVEKNGKQWLKSNDAKEFADVWKTILPIQQKLKAIKTQFSDAYDKQIYSADKDLQEFQSWQNDLACNIVRLLVDKTSFLPAKERAVLKWSNQGEDLVNISERLGVTLSTTMNLRKKAAHGLTDFVLKLCDLEEDLNRKNKEVDAKNEELSKLAEELSLKNKENKILRIGLDNSNNEIDELRFLLSQSITSNVVEPKTAKASETVLPEYNSDVMLEKVDSLGLSTRTLNVLKMANINIIGELVVLDDDQMMNIPRFGKKCLAEIKEKLNRLYGTK